MVSITFMSHKKRWFSILPISTLILLPCSDAKARHPINLEGKTLLPLEPYIRATQSHVTAQAEPSPFILPNDIRHALYPRGEEKSSAVNRRMFSQGEITTWDQVERGKRDLSWDLQIAYEEDTFFDGWDFFTDNDPSHGLVNYVDKETAFGDGLAFFTDDGVPGIQVDHWSQLAVNTSRNSVRISTEALFAGGLFIIDMPLMPWGCGVWPAFWTLGYEGTWPSTGEIDIVEGIQSSTKNQMTIHTLPGCVLNQTAGLFTGSVKSTVCDSSTGGSGCSIVSNSSTSYGEGFNAAGGGVFAMLWDGNGIRIWNWNRAGVPSDITVESPDPDTWGLPEAAWDSSTCDVDYFFQAQVLILNIDLCGDWAGKVYSLYKYCPDTCAEYIANPSNLNNTVMLINSIKVFQQSGRTFTTEQAASYSNLTGAGGAVGKASSGRSTVNPFEGFFSKGLRAPPNGVRVTRDGEVMWSPWIVLVVWGLGIGVSLIQWGLTLVY